MLQRILILSLICTSSLLIRSSGEVRVTPKLYGSAHLPCTFPIIRSSEDLTLVWVQVEDDGTTLVVHKFKAGRDDLSDQDPQYRGRTQLLGDISKGNLELTLTEVTFSDEGKYYCRAANRKGHGETKVELSIEGLEAGDPKVTFDHESQRMKCISQGRFRDPQVKWYRRQKEDLSNFATLNITALSDGWMMVESVLEYNVDKKDHYFCHIEEGRLRTSVHRAVISGEVRFTPKLYGSAHLSCTFPFIRSSEDLTLVWVKVEYDGTTLVVHKFMAGRDDLSDQDPQYRGRTQLLGDISKGNLELRLTEVTFSDEGNYYCRAANRKGHEETKVELSIDGLEADDPKVTFDHESQRMKCIVQGRFRDPQVKWYRRQKEDLSNFATLNIITLSDGRMMVESVLEYNVDKKDHYICHIEEGGLRTSVHRAVLSDGLNPVRVDDEL